MKQIPYLSLIVFFLSTLFYSCSKENADNKELILERFNGKYKILSSISNEAVDINMDGKSSTDLKTELPDLSRAFLELRILDQPYHLFSLWWPEQYLSESHDINKPNINYANQGIGFRFNFTNDFNKIILDTTDVTSEQASRFVVPESVIILKDDIIKVVFNESVYTEFGWKTIRVTTTYQRYTSIT
jgi:hypothetical protein